MIVTCKKLCGVPVYLPKWPGILAVVGLFALGCNSVTPGTVDNDNGATANDNVAESVGSIDNLGSTVTLSGSREDRTLTIHAMYLVDPEAPYALPANGWMEALTADPHFGQGLKRLELSASSRESKGRATLYAFTLIAEWQAHES